MLWKRGQNKLSIDLRPDPWWEPCCGLGGGVWESGRAGVGLRVRGEEGRGALSCDCHSTREVEAMGEFEARPWLILLSPDVLWVFFYYYSGNHPEF